MLYFSQTRYRQGIGAKFSPVAWMSLLLLICVVWGVRSGAWAQGSVGSVTAISGSADLVRNGHKMKVTLAMAVLTGDRLTTGHDSLLTLTFADNSRLLLSGSTTITINPGLVGTPSSSITRVGLLGGQLRSIINRGLRSAGVGFEVRTQNAIAGVRGTIFETKYVAGTPCPGFPDCKRYTDVGVYRGRVEVRNPLNPSAAPVIVGEGYETTVPCEEPPATPSPLGMSELTSPAYR